MSKLRSTVLWVVLILILGLVNYGVYQKETIRSSGDILYLELAPVDPRSLLQGDYMRLDYALLRELSESDLPKDGQLVINISEQRIGLRGELFDGTTPLADDQLLINYRGGDNLLRIAAENYFFQEGQGEQFEDAEYAELRVSPTGDIVLTGLMDGELVRLGDE